MVTQLSIPPKTGSLYFQAGLMDILTALSHSSSSNGGGGGGDSDDNLNDELRDYAGNEEFQPLLPGFVGRDRVAVVYRRRRSNRRATRPSNRPSATAVKRFAVSFRAERRLPYCPVGIDDWGRYCCWTSIDGYEPPCDCYGESWWNIEYC
jgi:hypothetical protein